MERSSFFNSIAGDRRYLAENWAAYFASFIGNGVFPQPSNGLQVMAGITGTTVIIRPGKAWINGYFYENDDELILQLPTADGVLPRIDRIVLRWDLTERKIRARVHSGAPASNPTPPPLQRDADAYELCLADHRMPAGATTVSQGNITDQRWNTALCGVVAGVVQQIDPSFITAQFEAFFAEYRPKIEADYAEWKDNIKNTFELYDHLVRTGYAEFSTTIEAFFNLFQQNTITQFNLYMSTIQSLRENSEAAYEAFLVLLNSFMTTGTADFNAWFETIKGILDEDAAGHILLLIQELQTFAPTATIGTITHTLGRYPLCTLHSVTRAAGIGGAGEGGAGGDNLVTVPAEFEIDGFDRVTIKTTAQHASLTDIYKISETTFGFADPDDPANLTSLFLIMR